MGLIAPLTKRERLLSTGSLRHPFPSWTRGKRCHMIMAPSSPAQHDMMTSLAATMPRICSLFPLLSLVITSSVCASAYLLGRPADLHGVKGVYYVNHSQSFTKKGII
ncbi:hypothetical protein BOTBODRAFT_409659 [Botryobasidium botryosum FD-172 SS1]|uniref:Uncharacterized protein n=1 Tax=Botryobasidium botryosum (strain FD-172 SS1) TaxID=930990 RepID=A0A067MMD8_BOTB1|nr:hypothetical protein BOTBODRAFT_409659 [Botryobasidium botryosum FD-172 SS1]